MVALTMTHGSIPPAECALLGIGDDLICLSCGIEDADDLIHDIKRALDLAVQMAWSMIYGVTDGTPSLL